MSVSARLGPGSARGEMKLELTLSFLPLPPPSPPRVPPTSDRPASPRTKATSRPRVHSLSELAFRCVWIDLQSSALVSVSERRPAPVGPFVGESLARSLSGHTLSSNLWEDTSFHSQRGTGLAASMGLSLRFRSLRDGRAHRLAFSRFTRQTTTPPTTHHDTTALA